MSITGLVFLNNKTQQKYVVLSETVMDCTNRNSGCVMVLYKPLSITNTSWYVRDRQEFLEKFTLFVAE